MKNPIVAALLNLIPGAGYLYLEMRKPFAWLLLLSCVASFIAGFVYYFQPYETNIWIIVSSTIAQIAFMVDAYLAAKTVNGISS